MTFGKSGSVGNSFCKERKGMMELGKVFEGESEGGLKTGEHRIKPMGEKKLRSGAERNHALFEKIELLQQKQKTMKRILKEITRKRETE